MKPGTALAFAMPYAITLLLASTSYALADTVQWPDVPSAVRQTISGYSDGGKVDTVNRESKRDMTVYGAEITKSDGQRIKMEVKADGQLTELKHRSKFFNENISWANVPSSVQNVVNAITYGGRVDKVEKEVKEGEVIYDAKVKTPEKTIMEVKVGEDGKVKEVNTSKEWF